MAEAFIAKTPLQSRVRQTTRLVVLCTTSQCRLRYPFRNLRVTNVIFIVTYYTLPRIESPDSSWMTRSQRSRRRDKGLMFPFTQTRKKNENTRVNVYIWIQIIRKPPMRQPHAAIVSPSSSTPTCNSVFVVYFETSHILWRSWFRCIAPISDENCYYKKNNRARKPFHSHRSESMIRRSTSTPVQSVRTQHDDGPFISTARNAFAVSHGKIN